MSILVVDLGSRIYGTSTDDKRDFKSYQMVLRVTDGTSFGFSDLVISQVSIALAQFIDMIEDAQD